MIGKNARKKRMAAMRAASSANTEATYGVQSKWTAPHKSDPLGRLVKLGNAYANPDSQTFGTQRKQATAKRFAAN